MHIACQLHGLAWPNLAHSALQTTGLWIAVEFARLRADNTNKEKCEDDGPHAAGRHAALPSGSNEDRVVRSQTQNTISDLFLPEVES